jgi:hypothetical protein
LNEDIMSTEASFITDHNLLLNMHDTVEQWEDQATFDLNLHQLESLLMRCVKLSQVLVAGVQQKRMEESSKNPILPNNSMTTRTFSDNLSVPIPPEVLRQMIPFLSAHDMGRLFLLTSPNMAQLLGTDRVWREICSKLWPDCMSSAQKLLRDGYYQMYFRQRQKPITLDQDQLLQPLPKPRLHADDLTLCLDIYNDTNELVSTKTIDNSQHQVTEFVQTGSLTINLDSLIDVGTLPRQSGCHCWNLPKSYPGWKARLHLFVQEGHKIKRGHALLDTAFSAWRGWSENGELSFLQPQRTKGLYLTDRGRYIQHRIVTGSRKTPNWRHFLGVQSKVILVCEKVNDSWMASDMQRFCFTKVRVEAIRLHENSAGNVQHGLFRKDPGWKAHGVELLHLLEELY